MTIPWMLRQAMFAPAASEGVIPLTVIDRPGFDDPIRLTSHAGILSYDPYREGVTHDGDEYRRAVVSLPRFPDDIPGATPTLPVVLSTLTEDDLARLATEGSVNDIVVTQTHVALSDPETIVVEFPAMLVRAAIATFASKSVALSLSFGRRRNEPGNALRFTPDMFGALPF